ncbi:MAG: TRAM domain-containing protein, partial [Bacteroidales bacterium]|nr:TRAM domain-containing protein [Candidatus Equibacterium intestinale]
IFPYSRRGGTPAAARTDQVQESVKSAREARLQALCDRLHSEFIRANSGRTLPVLFESKVIGGRMFGYTDNYIKVERPYDRSLIGKIVDVKL